MTTDLTDFPSPEVDALHERVLKYELIVSAVGNLLNKNLMCKRDEERVLFALNPTELGVDDFKDLGIQESTYKEFFSQSTKLNIPTLKRLVEKDIDEKYGLLQELLKLCPTDQGAVDIPAVMTDIQNTGEQLSQDVLDLSKQLRTLVNMRVRRANEAMDASLDSIANETNETLRFAKKIEHTVITEITGQFDVQHRTNISIDLDRQIDVLNREHDEKKALLEKYRAGGQELLDVTDQIHRLNEQIVMTEAALKALE